MELIQNYILEFPDGAYEITQINQEIYRQMSNNHNLSVIYQNHQLK